MVTPMSASIQKFYQNGNLTETSAGNVYSWNYRNRITQTKGAGAPTTTYSYGHAGERVKKYNGTTTVYSPSDLYEVKGEKARGAFARGCRQFRLAGETSIQPEQLRYEGTTTKNIYAKGTTFDV